MSDWAVRGFIVDTHLLRTFLVIAETRSFSAAATALHVTQPAVSKRIRQLEDGLGVALFDRVGRSVHLTAAGHALRERAVAIIAAVDDAERELHNLSGSVDGPLVIATSHHIGLHRLPPVLRAFSQRHPGVRLDIRFVDSEHAHELLLLGQCELAVVTLDPDGHDRLRYQPVWHDALAFVAAADHPLAGRGTLRMADLCAHRAILPGPETYTGRIVLAMFEQARLRLEVMMATNYLETIRMLVSIGLGWSVLPATMLGDQLVALPLQGDPCLVRTLGAVTHPQRTLSNAARSLLAMLPPAGQARPVT